jgi:isoquinoline 1-oxidoreductase subunit beta
MSPFGDLRERAGRASLLPSIDRRTLLIGAGAAGGLALAWTVWPRDTTPGINANPGEHVFTPFLKIGEDGRVVVLVPQTEMGQGSYTLIPQAIADELGADWRTISVEPAPISGAYANMLLLDEDAAAATPRIGLPEAMTQISSWRQTMVSSPLAMLTGGASDMRMFADPARECAAYARALLCMAAAARWDVAWEECETEEGFVTHTNRRLRFGDLAQAAAAFDPPSYPPLRAPGSGAMTGQSMPRLDLPAKIDGSLNFAGDIRLPGMVYAAIRQGPHGDTRLKSYTRDAAHRIPGFISAVRNDRWLASVAVNSWIAKRALDAMAPVFTTSGGRADSGVIDRRLKAAVNDPDGVRMAAIGDVGEAMAGRVVIGADYAIAPEVHAQPETRTATAALAPDGATMRLWVGTQAPGATRAVVAEALGIAADAVALFQMPCGGQTGAAMAHDVAVQAALIARAVGRPVQLIWTRTEEILRDCPRAPARVRMRGTLSSGATIDALHMMVATAAARHEWRARLSGDSAETARRSAASTADAAAISGATPPYRIPNVAIDHLPVDTGLPAGYARAGADGFTVFARECFIDELAAAAEVDPLSFRIGMLGNTVELGACLQNATTRGEWGGGIAGSGQGIACHAMQGSFIALMAVARVGTNGIVVDRLIAAVDGGRVLNPTLARQQVESGIVHGLITATGVTSRYRRGLAQARRLGDLGLPTLAQMPRIEVELIPSNRDTGGLDEIGASVVAPAIANALFTVTSDRIRRLPLSSKLIP